MPKLIIEPTRCRIDDVGGEDDVGLLWALDRELAYNVQGSQFTRAYKGYMDPFSGKWVAWDGKNRFLDEETLSFPLGLKQRVIDFYKKMEVPLNVIDTRPPKSDGMSLDILPRLAEMGKNPRPYQIQAMQAAKDNDQGIIRMATGSGKTLLSALITADIGKKTLILVVGKDLLYQFKKFYEEVFQQPIGIIGDGNFNIHNINIATIWSVGIALGLNKENILSYDVDEKEKPIDHKNHKLVVDLLSSSKLIIFDEVHMSPCETFQVISKKINPEHIYGMSASPWRDDGRDLLIEAIFGHKIVEIGADYLIEQKYLAKPIIKFIDVPKYHTTLKKNYKSIYKTYICENNIRNKLIVENAEKLVKLGYKPLILYKSLHHGKILHDMISKKIPCVLLSGKDSTKIRDKAREDIKNGNVKVILASKIFDQGIDIPELSGLIVAGGGKSSTVALQRVGRVIRPCKNKKYAAVIDFFDNAYYVKEHSKIRKEIYKIEFEVE
jgi:superfamily II DNA or RNA helicase